MPAGRRVEAQHRRRPDMLKMVSFAPASRGVTLEEVANRCEVQAGPAKGLLDVGGCLASEQHHDSLGACF